MNILTKLKSLQRWQSDDDLTKFKCRRDENHEILIPFIKEDEVLLKCPTCNTIHRCVYDKAFKLGYLLLLDDERKKKL